MFSSGPRQQLDDFPEPSFNFAGSRKSEAEFERETLQFRPPLRRHGKSSREGMSRARFKYPADRPGGLRVVKLAEGVDQKDVQHVPRPARRRPASARMKFLRNLLGKTPASPC